MCIKDFLDENASPMCKLSSHAKVEDQWRITSPRSFQPQLHRHNDASPSALYSTHHALLQFLSSSQTLLQAIQFVKKSSSFTPQQRFHHQQTPITGMPVPMPSTTSESTPATQSSAVAQTAHNVQNAATQALASATHSEKTEQEKEAERRYEEAMEEEYAKREGGA